MEASDYSSQRCWLGAGESGRAESIARGHSNVAKRNLQAATNRETPLQQVAGGHLIKLRGE